MQMRSYPLKHVSLVLLAVGYGCLAASQARVSAEPANTNISPPARDLEPSAPLSQRFADADAEEVPDFQKHIVPLIGRLGCNGRACHGSFQGRGGFQLSLFGYDFKTDHQALLDESSGRVDVDDVDESLILSKPVDADMHEGGKRFDEGSWQHHVLRRWIERGAKFNTKNVQALSALEITPREIQFDEKGQTVELRAIAHWEDGTAENVTELCRFSSNDDAVAAIDESGRITSGLRGDTHVVVYYDNAVVPIPVMRAVETNVAGASELPAQPIDQLVQQKLDKLGIVPSGLCTDAEFIRRASLDMTGILPSSEQVREFLADSSPDKRQRLVDRLLDSPGYAAWWATRFSDWTGNSDEQLVNVLPVRGAATRLWYQWLRTRLDANMPYDDIIEGVVTAQSRQEGEGYAEYCESMTKACAPGNENLFAERDGLPMYWARRNFQKTEERAIGFAYTFLGVRIECAQCHKHPFDQWSKDDFEQFASLFSPIRVNANQVAPDAKKIRQEMIDELTGGKKMNNGDLRRAMRKAAQEGKTVPFGELLVNTANARKGRGGSNKKARNAVPSGKILGQAASIPLDRDPRLALMDWLRSPENPYFSKAIVNRVWSNYFGMGIVDPTDDINLANPPVNAPLFDYLADEFVRNGFDLKWLHRTIVTSETYQRSAETNESNVMDRSNFSHHIPRRLPAEVVHDAVLLATGSDQQANQLRSDLEKLAIADGKPRRRNQQDFALEVFGQSIRESNCDCDRSNSPSLLQSIYLRNDQEMHKRLSDKDGWVAQACQALGVAGPKSNDPKAKANQRTAEAARRQFRQRIGQFRQQPEKRKRRMQPQLEREYQRLTAKMNRLGYQVPKLTSLIEDFGTWGQLEQVSLANASRQSIQTLVGDAYLRTLSRYPDSEETDISVSFVEESDSTADGIQSLLWALVNTKEFIISH